MRRKTVVQPQVRHLAAPLLLGIVLLGAWLLLARGLPSYVLPTPGAVVRKLWTGITTLTLLAPLGATLLEAASGCLAGAALAIPLAILLHRSRWADSATRPFLGATQAIPAIALAPLLVLWVGYGLLPITLLCALIVFFPILVAAASGLRHVDHEVVDAARMDGASPAQSLFHIELPLALPWIYSGLRNGFTLSVTGAVVGEMVMGGTGLGTVLVVQRDRLDTAGMFATIGLLAAVASAAYLALVGLERHSSTVQSLVHES